ncbi:MAG: hypothetical protein IID36_07115, partial [Planctomycetes bacterium]|nr:hypothetical protein [Planctomycetota bacterium]
SFGEEEVYILRPRMKNCGEIVFTRDLHWQTTSEILRYDNGFIEQLTTNNTPDAFPDINDAGTVVWNPDNDSQGSGDIAIIDDGIVNFIGNGTLPRINLSGKAVWSDLAFSQQPCAFTKAIIFFEGLSTTIIHNDGLSNQTPVINDNDDIAWTRFDFCPGGQGWEADIYLWRDGVATALTSDQLQPTAPSINNKGHVAWNTKDHVTLVRRIELWENGDTSILTDWGSSPKLNDNGDIGFFRWYDTLDIAQAWIYYDGAFLQIFNDASYSFVYDINNFAELVMAVGIFPATDVGYMRRIRTGEADFDGHIDLRDAAAFQNCMTGPGDFDGTVGGFDRLCDCRFLDIDHDRDVDRDDYALFATAMTGPE